MAGLTIYDQAYGGGKPLFGPQPDLALAQLVIGKGLRGRALDLGAGDGRNAAFLAQHGFAVEAVDLSATAVAKLSSLARRTGLDIRAAATEPSLRKNRHRTAMACRPRSRGRGRLATVCDRHT